MAFRSRRGFLKAASAAGVAAAAGHLLAPFSRAQASGLGGAFRVDLDTRRTLAPLDRNIFGSFLEHLGRAIYEGIYDPGTPLADGNGFRTDVLDEIRKMQVDPKKDRIWLTYIGVFETRDYQASDIGSDGHGGHRPFGFGHLNSAPGQLLVKTIKDLKIEPK